MKIFDNRNVYIKKYKINPKVLMKLNGYGIIAENKITAIKPIAILSKVETIEKLKIIYRFE